MHRKLLPLILICLLAQPVFLQTTETTKDETAAAELRSQAVAFLRETASEVGALRTLENRISLSSEMASLMWFHDKKEARAMFAAAISDFKQLLSQYDAQISASGVAADDESFHGAGLFNPDQSDKARMLRKFAKAVAVRQQISASLAEHDPQLAFDFYNESLQVISNPDLRKRIEGQDAYFVTRLLKETAGKDPAKAAEFGRRSLAQGMNYEHIELLKKIYEKDAAKGAEFGEEVVKKFKGEKAAVDGFYMIGSVLRLGAENAEKAKTDGKKPMFSEQSLRDLSELLAQSFLTQGEGQETVATEYLDVIEKFAPARAAQLRTKFATRRNKSGDASKAEAPSDEPPPLAPKSIAIKGRTDQKEAEEQLSKEVQNLANKELPPEERAKIVGQARKIIAEMPNKQAQLLALSGLATQVMRAGDKEFAAALMTEAQGMANAAPKNYQDFMEVWLLAGGFAQVAPEKAFPLLDDAVFRLNETIAAFVKVGEFMDISGEMIEDGEVQIGAFGGSMTRELTRELGQADATLRHLAVADFAKTKTLTNRFEKQEVRILAKMLVLRAVLGAQNENKPAAPTEKPADGL